MDGLDDRQTLDQPSALSMEDNFVANRVNEIQELSQHLSVTWHHCQGSQNPADITTRGATVVGLHDTFWQNGPRWLIQRESWPLERLSYTEESKKELTVQPVIATPEKEKRWTRFSKWTTVAGVVRTMLSWKYRSLIKFEINRKAEHILFRIIQKECFPEEFRSLTANQKVQRDSKLIQFRPFLGDDGLIRASRRLQLSDLEEDTKHPVIMADHVLTVLLFRFIHENNMHLAVTVHDTKNNGLTRALPLLGKREMFTMHVFATIGVLFTYYCLGSTKGAQHGC